jgi:PAS domain S-box-containing protein
VHDQEGRVAKWYGTSTEIDNLKQAEQKLLEATTRLDFLVTESPAVVFTYELRPRPHLNYISRNVETILGWKPERFTEDFECWKECLHPDDVSVVFDGLVQLEKTGQQVFEYRFKDVKGRYHWIHDEQRIIVREGGRKDVIGAWWDVTETKAAQEELLRLATAIEQAAEIVVITDERAEIVYANPAFEKITGYSQTEVLGKNPHILKSGEHDH